MNHHHVVNFSNHVFCIRKKNSDYSPYPIDGHTSDGNNQFPFEIIASSEILTHRIEPFFSNSFILSQNHFLFILWHQKSNFLIQIRPKWNQSWFHLWRQRFQMFSHRVSKLRSEWRISKILGIDIRMNFEIENFDEKFWWKRVKIRKFQDQIFHVQSHLIISYFENLDKVTCKNGGLHWSISKADFHQYDHGFFRGKCDPVKSRDGTHYEMTIPFGSCGLKRKVWWSNNTIHYMVSSWD